MSSSVKENPQIERSPGEIATVGGLPARFGAGYEGKRDDQDEAIVTFAERLSEKFPEYDIQIRYNNDRLSGSAWLKDAKESAQIGLGAALRPSKEHRKQQERYYWGESSQKPPRLSTVDPEELVLMYTLTLEPPAVEPSRCNRRTETPEKQYLAKDFHTLDGAWGYFEAFVISDGIHPPENHG